MPEHHIVSNSPENTERKQRTIPLVKGKTLEVGCADGWMTKHIAKKVETYVVDISVTHLQIARKKASKANYILSDAHRLPFKERSFNTVICEEVLEHLQTPPKAINEIHRVLKKGGTTIITVPNAMYWRRIALHIIRQEKRATTDPHHLQNIDAGILSEWLTKARFRKIRITGIKHPPLLPLLGKVILAEANR